MQHSLMGTPVLADQKNLDSSALYGDWLTSRGLSKNAIR